MEDRDLLRRHMRQYGRNFAPVRDEEISRSCIAQHRDGKVHTQTIGIGFYRRPCPRVARKLVKSAPIMGKCGMIETKAKGVCGLFREHLL